MTDAQRPTRSARRTIRGWHPPTYWAASGVTAETIPIPTTNTVNSTVCASAAAATALSPSRPISARSLVIMAIWPSCVSAIGSASLTVSVNSARQSAVPAGALASAADMTPGMVMARTIIGRRINGSDDFVLE